MQTLFVFLGFITIGLTDRTFKLCQKDIQSDDCKNLRKFGDSKVECVEALDMAHCAILMSEGKADFGVYLASGLLLAHQFYPNNLTVLADLRNKKNAMDDFMYESVAVVSAKELQPDLSLKGKGFCHPGFRETNLWDDYVLKYFEKEMYGRSKCRLNLSVVENDAYNLKEYFGKACRPGKWVLNSTLDVHLKNKYPELCSLCDTSSCDYNNSEHYGHYGALDCLTKGRGAVAYVARRYVDEYFEINKNTVKMEDYKLLCPDKKLESLNFSSSACSWVKQPWDSVVARKEISDELYFNLKIWNSTSSSEWGSAVFKILEARYQKMKIFNEPEPSDTFLKRGRDTKLPTTCGKEIRWCTISEMETNKCNWVSAQALALGIEPKVSCKQTDRSVRSQRMSTSNLFDCFSKISANAADVMTVDSNYGLLVRDVYNLSNVLYCGTDKNDYSVVLAVLRETTTNTIKSFDDLKKRNACFPEYGGIAWLSFLNNARRLNLISKSCDYPKIVADFFSGVCAPGIAEHHRWSVRSPVNSKINHKLCSICHLKDKIVTDNSCSASQINDFYGTAGALKCLTEGPGDVAFIEVQHLVKNLSNYNLDPKNYRILCKNGSLATYPGFNVDDKCALSVAIDSEVVSRRKNSPLEISNIKNALLKIEDWMGYGIREIRPIRIYEPFNSTDDLIFKTSTNVLLDSTVSFDAIDEYKDIMSHVDICTDGASTLTFSFTTLLIIVFVRMQI